MKKKIIKILFRCSILFVSLLLIVFLLLYAINRKYIIDARNNEYKILKNMSSEDFELKDVNPTNHIFVSFDNVSPYLIDGYIAVEDQRFYKHNGINPITIMKAFWKIIESNGKVVSGGSTITQQVVKNNILSQEKTIERKIKEAYIAFDFEKHFSKEEIMEIYLNTNYYGNGCYGVEKASNYYFGKSANELSISECAVLIGTSNSPNNYNPIDNYDLCVEKRNKVLEMMKNEEVITQEEYNIAINEEICVKN